MLILASQSPRRKRLLTSAGLQFDIRPVDIDESLKSGETPEAFVRRLAREKAQASFDRGDHESGAPILAADTIVTLDDDILGKPRDPEDAVKMLQRLSGRTHVVFTGICVLGRDRSCYEQVVSTPVTFRALSEASIRRYVATPEPHDKAGAYAIQGEGGAMVESVHGSYTNVIGLPLTETLELLKKVGVSL